VTRGRGDAAITFGKESDAQGVKFKEVVLPPGTLDDPDNRILKITGRAPNVDPAVSAKRGAARELGSTAGGASWNRRLRPRHRGVVRKYFGGDRGGRSGKSSADSGGRQP
jgi:hypothetical protein